MNRGFIKGTRAPFSYGLNRVWSFEYEAIIECIRKRPWLAHIKRMEQSYFRTVALEEYQSNPWYTCGEAAPLLGLVDHNAVQRYIKRGWLRADRKPGAGGLGQYVIRQRDIDVFLLDDPRPGNRSWWMKAVRKQTLRRERQRQYRLRRKMPAVDWRGRGTKVKHCPVGRESCHEQCPARKESRCCFRSRTGTELRWLRLRERR